MTVEYVLALGREAISMTLLIAAPMLILGLLVGVTISILQAVTQIQEMTLTFVPKIIAVAAALLIFLPWIITRIVTFTAQLYGNIPNLVG
jgi:flagellar biosynthetic protein FliQ